LNHTQVLIKLKASTPF